jgi:hypothetical protein
VTSDHLDPALAPEARRLRKLADPAPSRTLYALCRLSVPDQLRDGSRTTAELASRVGADEDALDRVMRAGAELGVVEPEAELTSQDGARRWKLRAAGRLLCHDEPGSLRAELADNDFFSAWAEFEYSVRTGQPSYPKVFGRPLYDRMQANQHSLEEFHRHMYARAQSLYGPLLDLDIWPRQGTVVDVGGGTGGLLAQLLAARPGLTGILHDLPSVVALSPLAESELSDRVRFVGGDVFRAVPTGGDLYVLASILHNWDDQQALTILRRCREAVARDGRIFLLERSMPESGICAEAFGDLCMLAMTGGRERTQGDWSKLSAAAGLTLTTACAVSDSEIKVLVCEVNS